MTEYALNELAEWIEDGNIRDTWEHEDYEDVKVYQSKSLDIICVRSDAECNPIEAWME